MDQQEYENIIEQIMTEREALREIYIQSGENLNGIVSISWEEVHEIARKGLGIKE